MDVVNRAWTYRGDVTDLLPCDGTATYHQAFFAPREADRLFEELSSEVAWAQERARLFGRELPLPRLTAWYGPVPYAYSGVVHPPAAMPPVVEAIRSAIAPLAPAMDCVLANRYRDGRDSVSWHADDEAIWGEEPTIASVSFGARRRFVFRHRQSGEKVAVELGHGSLLLMAGSSQRCWLHAVPKTGRAVGERVNLTFRRLAALSPR